MPSGKWQKQAIRLGMTDVYQDANGQEGKSEELAAKFTKISTDTLTSWTSTTDFLKVLGRVFLMVNI